MQAQEQEMMMFEVQIKAQEKGMRAFEEKILRSAQLSDKSTDATTTSAAAPSAAGGCANRSQAAAKKKLKVASPRNASPSNGSTKARKREGVREAKVVVGKEATKEKDAEEVVSTPRRRKAQEAARQKDAEEAAAKKKMEEAAVKKKAQQEAKKKAAEEKQEFELISRQYDAATAVQRISRGRLQREAFGKQKEGALQIQVSEGRVMRIERLSDAYRASE
jgi:hypothetical protein